MHTSRIFMCTVFTATINAIGILRKGETHTRSTKHNILHVKKYIRVITFLILYMYVTIKCMVNYEHHQLIIKVCITLIHLISIIIGHALFLLSKNSDCLFIPIVQDFKKKKKKKRHLIVHAVHIIRLLIHAFSCFVLQIL